MFLQISGCGYTCSECILMKNGICSSCNFNNSIALKCSIMSCLVEKKLDTCLHCELKYKDGVCKTYKKGIRHCPLRFEVLGQEDALKFLSSKDFD